MKTLNYKTFATCLIGMLVLFASCLKDEIKEEEGFKIETECSIDGVDIPVTKAENEKGWTTGDGIYHRGDNVVLTANAKSGYELVTFYDKANPSRNVGSPYSFKAQETATYKAEFRSTAPMTYCINCSITGQGSVSGTGCGKTNGTYTLTANPNPGWSASWTTKQVTVNGGDVNTSVTFTKQSTNISITVCSSGGGKININGGSYSTSESYTGKVGDVITVAARKNTVNDFFTEWSGNGFSGLPTPAPGTNAMSITLTAANNGGILTAVFQGVDHQ